MKPRKDFYRVGEILGPPTPIDPDRPNMMGGASPEKLHEGDYPLYHTRKSCRVCSKPFNGLSMSPQYDDEPLLFGWCGCQLQVSPGFGPWNTPKPPKTHYRDSKPPRNDHHNLYD